MKTWHLVVALILILWLLNRAARKTIAGQPAQNADANESFFKPFELLSEPWVDEGTQPATGERQAQSTVPAGSDAIFFVPNPFNPLAPAVPVDLNADVDWTQPLN